MMESSILLKTSRRCINYACKSLAVRSISRLFSWFFVLLSNSFFFHPFFNPTPFAKIAEASKARILADGTFTLTKVLGTRCAEGIRSSKAILLARRFLHRPGWIFGGILMVLTCVPNDNWNNAYNTILALLLFFYAVVRAVVLQKPFIKKGTMPLSLLLFIAIVCLAQALSQDFALSIRFFIFYATAFLFCISALSMLDEAKTIKQTITLWLTGTFFTGLYGIWQNATGAIKFDPTQTDAAFKGSDLPGRIYSTFGNPNNYAELLILTIPLFVAMIIIVKKPLAKLAFAGMLVPLVMALMLTGSRSAWISIVFGLVVFMLLLKPKWIPLLLIGGLCMSPFLPDYVTARMLSLFNGTDSSSRYRQTIFRTVKPVFKGAWFEGVGVGPQIFVNTILQFPLYTLNPPPHVHRTIYQVWIEFGIVGAGALCVFVFGTLARAVRAIVAFFKTKYAVLLAGLIASIAGITLMSIGEHVWFYPRMMVCFFVTIALLLAWLSIDKES